MDPLAYRDVLLTIAQVSAAFVGFSMVVAAIQSRSSHPGARFSAIRDVAEIGLYVIAGALLPIGAHAFNLDSTTVWRLSSAVVGSLWILGFTFAQIRFRRAGAGLGLGKLFPIWAAMAIGCVLLGNILLWWNVVVPGGLMAARYLLALVLWLSIAGGLFINATFREPNP
jgi:hypothetical protein